MENLAAGAETVFVTPLADQRFNPEFFMRITLRPVGQAFGVDVTDWLVEAIAAQLERRRSGRRAAVGGDEASTGSGERNRRAAMKHLRIVIESVCELAADVGVERRIGEPRGGGLEVGSIFACPDFLSGECRRLPPCGGIAIADNTQRVRIRMMPKLTGQDGRSGLGGRGDAERTDGEQAAAP